MGAYRPSYVGIGELLRADFIEADMVDRAVKVLARAEATAPYDVKDRDGIHYRDSFVIESSSHGGVHKDRAEAQVVNVDGVTALLVEFGSIHNPKHRTLGKALDAAGDYISSQNAASLLSLSGSDVSELARRGVLESAGSGRQRQISKASVDRLLGTGFQGDFTPKPRKPRAKKKTINGLPVAPKARVRKPKPAPKRGLFGKKPKPRKRKG